MEEAMKVILFVMSNELIYGNVLLTICLKKTAQETPLVAKICPIVEKSMRKGSYFSPPLKPQ